MDIRSLRALREIAGKEHVLTAPEDLICYSYDATPYSQTPAAVVLPGSTGEISALLKFASETRTPVVARGAGTNLSGGSVPVPGCIVLAMQRLNRMLEIDADNLTAVVQPGVVLADFHRAVESRGLFYPPDPASLTVCTIGGTVAEGAGGPRGMKYGTTRNYVLALEAVLADGAVIRTGSRAVKDVSGYDLTRLLVGSEGTLAVVTEATLRLLPLPETKETCLAAFDTVEQAAEAVTAILRARIVPATLELMDDVCITCIEAYRPAGLPGDAGAALLIEVDGTAGEVALQRQQVARECEQAGARSVRVARDRAEADELWTGRRSCFAAMARMRPSIIVEDATVPRQRLPEMVRAIKEAAQRHSVFVGILAHAGDGNMHPRVMFDGADEDEVRRVRLFTEELFRAALSLGGTLTGEHGIGLLKRDFLAEQFGEAGVELMRRIKHAFDPHDILNPGKMLPPRQAPGAP